MITFSHLGKFGKLGNQLFQIATTYSHARKNNTGYSFPEWKYSKYLKTPLPIITSEFPESFYRENDPFSYREIPNKNQLDLLGYFQNENYFNEYKNEILKLLEPSQDTIDLASSQIPNIGRQKITAVHIRRGDYLNHPNHHPLPPIEYYRASIEMLGRVSDNFLVFSDDIKWCKENFPSGFIFSEESDEFVDLIKMSMCDNYIIANSSFSWWGSYLNDGFPQVIAPKRWVGVGYENTGWSGVYRKEMILI
jgi:hypothetical protein